MSYYNLIRVFCPKCGHRLMLNDGEKKDCEWCLSSVKIEITPMGNTEIILEVH